MRLRTSRVKVPPPCGCAGVGSRLAWTRSRSCGCATPTSDPRDHMLMTIPPHLRQESTQRCEHASCPPMQGELQSTRHQKTAHRGKRQARGTEELQLKPHWHHRLLHLSARQAATNIAAANDGSLTACQSARLGAGPDATRRPRTSRTSWWPLGRCLRRQPFLCKAPSHSGHP